MEVQAPTTTQLNVYLTFNGNCEEAINYYKSVLGGEIEMMSRFADGPMEVPEEHKNNVMHTTYKFDGCSILASDTGGQQPFTAGTNYSLSVFLPEKERATDVFSKLSDGGSVAMPFQEVFWGGSFGQLTDKFGINWMVSCP